MIEPSIGRVVWYHPKPQDGDPSPLVPHLPYAAFVTCWLDLRTVSLAIFDHKGQLFAREHVSLAQDEDVVEQGMAEWMPFQKGQAAKYDKPAFDAEGSFKELHEAVGTIRDFTREHFKAILERVEPLEAKSHVPVDFSSMLNRIAEIEQHLKALSTPAGDPPTAQGSAGG